MSKELKIQLTEKTYETLIKLFRGNEKTLCAFVSSIVTQKTSSTNIEKIRLNSDNLEDYLKLSDSKKSAYGAKGQGW